MDEKQLIDLLRREEVQNDPKLFRDINLMLSLIADDGEEEYDQLFEISTYEYVLKDSSLGFDANNLLEEVILMERQFENHPEASVERNHMRSLAELAIKYGADVNLHYLKHSNKPADRPLDLIKDPKIATILKDHGAKCSSRDIDELYEAGLGDVIFNPNLINEQKYKNLAAEKALMPKMPYNLNFIWLTSVDNPREINAKDLMYLKETVNTFSSAPVVWKFILWTNTLSSLPNSIRSLNELGIEVRSIYEYQDEIRLFPEIEDLIAQKAWGMAADTLRISLVEHLGGLYADLNFKFERDLTEEVHKYNFFTKANLEYYILQSFFGASAHHPVLNEALDLIERNLGAKPSYISNLEHIIFEYTITTTANTLSLAYYKKANIDGNIDVVYPSGFTDKTMRSLLRDLLDKKALQQERCVEQTPLTDLKMHIDMHDLCDWESDSFGDDVRADSWIEM